MDFPNRSRIRVPKTKPQDWARAVMGLARAWPIAQNHEESCVFEIYRKDTPTTPAKGTTSRPRPLPQSPEAQIGASQVSRRKKGIIGYNISLEISVNKLTNPREITFRGSRYFCLARRSELPMLDQTLGFHRFAIFDIHDNQDDTQNNQDRYTKAYAGTPTTVSATKSRRLTIM